jgi:uncharacterized protein YkwD
LNVQNNIFKNTHSANKERSSTPKGLPHGSLNYVNDIRSKIGVKTVQLDPFLVKASQNHADYPMANNQASHEEDKGKTGLIRSEFMFIYLRYK